MFTIDDVVYRELYSEGLFHWPDDRIQVDALYLFPEVAIKADNLIDPYVKDIPAFDNFRLWEQNDQREIERMIKDNPEKYIPLIKANITENFALGIYHEMNERNGDMHSPHNIEYKVTAESLENFDNCIKSSIKPAVVLVDICVGLDYNPKIREQVNGFAKQKQIPLVIYAPEGRDDKSASMFKQIKEEWIASCGFVAGDAQWDGVLSVAETMIGFMGKPARDWMYERVVHPRLRELILR